MGRVSLTEDYDDRSVIAKLNEMDKRVTENTTVVTSAEASAKASAQAAQETADRFAGSVGAVVQNANAQINASKAQVDQAKAEVDATVTTVAQAVQTANNASASAQQSATTVATYDTRLTAVEDADTQNVKLSGEQNITGIKTVPTEATGVSSQQIANSTKIGAELDNYAPMVRTTGNVQKYGKMEMMNGLNGYVSDWRYVSSNSPMTIGQWCIFAEISNFSAGAYRIIEFIQGSNTASCYGKMLFNSEPNSPDAIWISIKGRGGNNPLAKDSIKILTDGNKIYLAWQKKTDYGSLRARQYASVDYGNTPVYNQDITWIKREEMPILDNLDNYTVFDVIE